jgi:hypothetical protein
MSGLVSFVPKVFRMVKSKTARALRRLRPEGHHIANRALLSHAF